MHNSGEDAKVTDSARSVLLRFAPAIYGPNLLFALGEGAVVPLIPVIATKLGADLSLSAFIATALVVGQLCGNLPAGWFVARLGERKTMVLAAVVALVGAAGIGLAPNLGVLAASVFVIGLAAAAFGLARHAFMVVHVPLAFRARALALLGGTFRFGMFAGPMCAALLLTLTGATESAAWFFVACLVGCAALAGLGPDPELEMQRQESRGPADAVTATGPIVGPSGVLATMWRHRGVLARMGVSASALSAVRQSRQVVLPLWGVSLGLDPEAIALVIGVTGAIDFALFYASGQVMDRFGRLMAVLPSMLIMGLGFLLLALSHDLPGAGVWYAAMAVLTGVGNGLSTGILMTLGADLSPRGDPAPFLGSWRLIGDAGGAAAPLLFSALAGVATIGIATAAVGVISLAGACGFARWIPRYITAKR